MWTGGKIVRIYYECQSATLVIRTLRKQYPEKNMLTIMPIYKFVRKFESKGTVSDMRHNPGFGRPRSVRTEENIDAIDWLITETPLKPR